MKAYLTDQDELVIEAESTVEVMALKYWSDDYFKRKPKRASLLLKFTVARPTQDAHTQDAHTQDDVNDR